MKNTEPNGAPEEVSSSPIVSFLLSRSSADDSGWLSTLGMLIHGYPELQIYPVAGNHCRAARFLLDLVARKLVLAGGEEQVDGSVLLELSRADVGEGAAHLLKMPEVEDEPQMVRIRLEMGPMPPCMEEEKDGEEEEEVELLSVLPPKDYPGSMAEWLRWACRSLGQDAPEALPCSAADGQMESAFERARRAAPEMRGRFVAGLGEGECLGVKFGLATRRGGVEYVWGAVLDWPELPVLRVRLESEPQDCKGYRYGQEMELPLDEVKDFVIGGMETGIVFPGYSQLLAEEFGMDLGES